MKKNQQRQNRPDLGSDQIDNVMMDTDAVVVEKTEAENIDEQFYSKPKIQSMKTIEFIVQAKGGTGKSFLAYLFALKQEKNEKALLVDLDSSTQSSKKNLKFLMGRDPVRLIASNLLDDRKKIVRDKLLSTIEGLVSLPEDYEHIYLDFGAPESEQLPALISHDLQPKDLKAFEEHLGVKFVFNIVVAGGTAYVSCTDYLQQLVDLVGSLFETNVIANENTFYNFNHLLEELKVYVEKKGNKNIKYKSFGDIDVSSDVGKAIMVNIEQGKGFDELSFIAKLKMRNELEKI